MWVEEKVKRKCHCLFLLESFIFKYRDLTNIATLKMKECLTLSCFCQGRDGAAGRAGKRGERGATVSFSATFA